MSMTGHQYCLNNKLGSEIKILKLSTTSAILAFFLLLSSFLSADSSLLLGNAFAQKPEEVIKEMMDNTSEIRSSLQKGSLVDALVHLNYIDEQLLLLINANESGSNNNNTLPIELIKEMRDNTSEIRSSLQKGSLVDALEHLNYIDEQLLLLFNLQHDQHFSKGQSASSQ